MVLAIVTAILFLIGFSCPAPAYAKGGHGHGGGHGGRFHGDGGYHGGYRSYGGYAFYGWYGAGFFGGPYLDPWYYYGTPYYDPYALSPAYAYPQPAAEETYEQGSAVTAGKWVEVPGQSVNGILVPPHWVWVPESS